MAQDDDLDVEEPEEGESTEWLITAADMWMLLLTFFIMLYSMSSLDEKKFTDSFTAVKQALGKSGKDLMTAPISSKEAGAIVDQVALRRQLLEGQKRIFTDIQYYNSRKGLEGIVGATIEEGTITLRVPSEVLFAQGSADLTPQGEAVIRDLKEVFIKHPDQVINIRGFTDDTLPRQGGRFKDNWELSSLRAVGVLRSLISSGLQPNRLTATGLADLEPLLPNTSDDNRAKNRRVEFVLEKRSGR